MTKKHFIELADVLRKEVRPHVCEDCFHKMLREMILFCHRQNPRFNESTFQGYIAGECGPSGGRIRKAA